MFKLCPNLKQLLDEISSGKKNLDNKEKTLLLDKYEHDECALAGIYYAFVDNYAIMNKKIEQDAKDRAIQSDGSRNGDFRAFKEWEMSINGERVRAEIGIKTDGALASSDDTGGGRGD